MKKGHRNLAGALVALCLGGLGGFGLLWWAAPSVSVGVLVAACLVSTLLFTVLFSIFNVIESVVLGLSPLVLILIAIQLGQRTVGLASELGNSVIVGFLAGLIASRIIFHE